jgi:hypothetical protein
MVGDTVGELRMMVFENNLQSIIFEPKSGEVTGKYIKLENEELNNLYSQPNNVCVIKSKRMRLEGHVVSLRAGLCLEDFVG